MKPAKRGTVAKGKPNARLVADLNQKLNKLGAQYRAFCAAGDFAQALKVTQEANRIIPGNPIVLGDAGLCYLRLGLFDEAYDHFRRATDLAPDNVNLLDGLTEVCGHLGRLDEVKVYGVRSLQIKDQQACANNRPLPLPALRPMSNDPKRNVIAFSLFGANPRYCETARINAEYARSLLPNWTCRFYLDQSVPSPVRAALSQAGVEVYLVNQAAQEQLSGLMWRFLVMDDQGIDRFLIRDADSLISTREVAAVNDWVASGRHFHVMRDAFSHTELVLAGMWGGCTGVFTNMHQRMADFMRKGNYLGQRVVDQHFLRAEVWPTIKQSLLSHDSVFGYADGQDFPAHEPHGLGVGFHVGANLAAFKIEGRVQATGVMPQPEALSWSIIDQQGQVVCSYPAEVKGDSWSAYIPQPYALKINAGEWRVVVG